MRVRGEFCVGSASVLCFTALILLIVANVAQINPSSVPRSIAMATMNVSAFGAALQAATGDPSPGLYNETAVSLGSASGLRVQYAWGFYTVCAYTTDPVQGSCSNSTFAHPFAPFAVLSSELPVRYQTSATFFISNAPGVEDFINSSYFTTLTQVSFYLLFLGTITSAAVFVLGLIKTSITFVLATFLALLASVCVLIPAVLWTVMVNKASTINSVESSQGVPLEIYVSGGAARLLLWAAFALLAVSTIPYLISCSTYRKVYHR